MHDSAHPRPALLLRQRTISVAVVLLISLIMHHGIERHDLQQDAGDEHETAADQEQGF
jgi:hypothetical protein